MTKPLGVLLFALGLTSTAIGDDARAEKLRREVADLRVKLAEKELELAKASPPKEVNLIHGWGLTVGEAGPWRDHTVEVRRILDDRRMLVGAGNAQQAAIPLPLVILANHPTAGIAEGRILKLSHVRVLGTEKIENRTLYVIEPYSPAKK